MAGEAPSADHFQLIPWQEQLADRMLSLSSFRRLFDGDTMAQQGFAKQGRRRTRRVARQELQARGYDERSATALVQDAEDYAALLHNAE